MNFFQPLPPPPPPPSNQLPQLSNNNLNPDVIGDTSSSSSSSLTSSIIILSIVISTAIILSVTIYLLLRRIHHSSRIHPPSSSTVAHVAAPPPSGLDSLPLFKFGSLTGTLTGGDCAVCLSKFESDDQLRLLPLCCHAFHARCIDTWLSNHQTCPLCRSTVYPTDADVENKTPAVTERSDGGSFRIEIGSVSRRRGVAEDGGRRRSFPIGSFEYIVDEGFDIPLHSTSIREKEFLGVAPPPGETLGAEVGGRNWLKDYVDRLASFSISSQVSSFRGSGRFFTGSSRRNDVVVPVHEDDLEANRRVGEEITELFRWISGV